MACRDDRWRSRQEQAGPYRPFASDFAKDSSAGKAQRWFRSRAWRGMYTEREALGVQCWKGGETMGIGQALY